MGPSGHTEAAVSRSWRRAQVLTLVYGLLVAALALRLASTIVLAYPFAVLFLVGTVLLVVRMGRARHKDLAALRGDPEGFEPSMKPGPGGVRGAANAAGAGLVFVALAVLVVVGPFAQGDCERRGISPNRAEGVCEVDGRQRHIVDAGHVARTPQFSAEVLASRTTRVPPSRMFRSYEPEDWPDPTRVVAVKVRVRNLTDRPLVFRYEPGETRTVITTDDTERIYTFNRPLTVMPRACTPLLERPLAPRSRRDAWVMAPTRDDDPVSGIQLALAAADDSEVRIRLDKHATPAGARAAALTEVDRVRC